MDTNKKIFSLHLLKQFIVFIILFQQVFCEDLDKSNGLIETKYSRKSRSAKGSSPLDDDQYTKLTTCLSKIQLGEITDAVDNFGSIYPPVPISDVLNISYHSNDIDNELLHFKNIIEFVIKQETRDHDKAAIETLQNLLTPTNHLDYLKAVLVYYLIENSPAKYDLSITYIQLKLKHNFLNKIKERCHNVLLNGVYDEELREFDKDYYEYFAPIVNEVFSETIDIKSNLTNKFDNILSFIRSYFNYVEDWVQVYSSLYGKVQEKDLLTNNNIAPKLGRDLRRFMTEESNYGIMNKPNRDIIENMCNTLDYCKNETLYNQLLQSSGATSVFSLLSLFSSIFMVISVIAMRC